MAFDKYRLADIIRDPAGHAGDVPALAEEVARLMGVTVDLEARLRSTETARAMWAAEAKAARGEAADLAGQVGDVLAAVPKTRRGQFAEIERKVAEAAPAS